MFKLWFLLVFLFFTSSSFAFNSVNEHKNIIPNLSPPDLDHDIRFDWTAQGDQPQLQYVPVYMPPMMLPNSKIEVTSKEPERKSFLSFLPPMPSFIPGPEALMAASGASVLQKMVGASIPNIPGMVSTFYQLFGKRGGPMQFFKSRKDGMGDFNEPNPYLVNQEYFIPVIKESTTKAGIQGNFGTSTPTPEIQTKPGANDSSTPKQEQIKESDSNCTPKPEPINEDFEENSTNPEIQVKVENATETTQPRTPRALPDADQPKRNESQWIYEWARRWNARQNATARMDNDEDFNPHTFVNSDFIGIPNPYGFEGEYGPDELDTGESKLMVITEDQSGPSAPPMHHQPQVNVETTKKPKKKKSKRVKLLEPIIVNELLTPPYHESTFDMTPIHSTLNYASTPAPQEYGFNSPLLTQYLLEQQSKFPNSGVEMTEMYKNYEFEKLEKNPKTVTSTPFTFAPYVGSEFKDVYNHPVFEEKFNFPEGPAFKSALSSIKNSSSPFDETFDDQRIKESTVLETPSKDFPYSFVSSKTPISATLPNFYHQSSTPEFPSEFIQNYPFKSNEFPSSFYHPQFSPQFHQNPFGSVQYVPILMKPQKKLKMKDLMKIQSELRQVKSNSNVKLLTDEVFMVSEEESSSEEEESDESEENEKAKLKRLKYRSRIDHRIPHFTYKKFNQFPSNPQRMHPRIDKSPFDLLKKQQKKTATQKPVKNHHYTTTKFPYKFKSKQVKVNATTLRPTRFGFSTPTKHREIPVKETPQENPLDQFLSLPFRAGHQSLQSIKTTAKSLSFPTQQNVDFDTNLSSGSYLKEVKPTSFKFLTDFHATQKSTLKSNKKPSNQVLHSKPQIRPQTTRAADTHVASNHQYPLDFDSDLEFLRMVPMKHLPPSKKPTKKPFEVNDSLEQNSLKKPQKVSTNKPYHHNPGDKHVYLNLPGMKDEGPVVAMEQDLAVMDDNFQQRIRFLKEMEKYHHEHLNQGSPNKKPTENPNNFRVSYSKMNKPFKLMTIKVG